MVFHKSLHLLPRPLITPKQINILENWEDNPDRYVQFDPILGWSIRPNAQATIEGQHYTANSSGIRALREYPLERVSGLTRIATFGPSFTHGDEVSDKETWQVQMEQTSPNLEVMNWGVGGYGTDQAFLRYRLQGQAYQPDIVIIGFEENNLNRNVNRFRPFFHQDTGIPLTKPVFVAESEGLRLIDNPFSDLPTLKQALLDEPHHFLDLVCPEDYYCRRAEYEPHLLDVFKSYRFLRTLAYELRSIDQPDPSPTVGQTIDGWQLNEVELTNWRLIQMFVAEIVGNGSTPVIVAFPDRSSIEALEQGYDQATFYRQGIIFLRQQSLHIVDVAPAFVADKAATNRPYADYYAPDGGHFNALGNSLVSQAVLTYLCEQIILANCQPSEQLSEK